MKLIIMNKNVVFFTVFLAFLTGCNNGVTAGTATNHNAAIKSHGIYDYCVVGAGPSAGIFINMALDQKKTVLQYKYQYPNPLNNRYFTFNLEKLQQKLNNPLVVDNPLLANIAEIRSGGALAVTNNMLFSTTAINNFSLGMESLFASNKNLKTFMLNDKIDSEFIRKLAVTPDCENIVIATGANEGLAKELGLEYTSSTEDYAVLPPGIPIQLQEKYGIEHYNIAFNYRLTSAQSQALSKSLADQNDVLQGTCHNGSYIQTMECIFNNNNHRLNYAAIIKESDDTPQLTILSVTDIPKNQPKPDEATIKALAKTFITQHFALDYNPENLLPGSSTFTVNPQKLNIPQNRNYVTLQDKKVYFVGDVYKHPIYYRGEGVLSALMNAEQVLDNGIN